MATTDIDAKTVLDWTATPPNPPPRLLDASGDPRYKVGKRGKVLVRDPKTVDGICVHQTACTYGPKASLKKRNERALGVPIHALAFRDGTLVLPYPPLWYLWHGNGWNRRSLGIEIEGTYAGVPGEKGDHDVLDDTVIAAARHGIRELVERGRAEGCPIRYIWAHRQSSRTRASDPGWEIWRHVVLDYAVATLGLVAQPKAVLDDGRAIPPEWG